MHRQYVHIGSRTLAYLDSAPADTSARTLVLVHAFPMGASMWEPQLHGIPEGWRIVAPDLRGFGGSTMLEDDETAAMDDYASDVLDLLAELGITSAVVGGLSLGGYVVFATLRRAAAMFSAVVLADTRGGPDTLEARANRKSMLAVLEREGALGVAREMMPKLLGPTTREWRADVEPFVRRLIKQQSSAAIRGAIVRMMERPDSQAVMQALAVPALVIVGDQDAMTPLEEARKIAAAVPNAELVVVPQSGHMSNLEQPEAFNSALWGFLGRL